ncbi:MAG: esterase [Oligoflexia bacterium]|nr:MAG: esterase [Oligoflexia bacterium]
MRQIGKIKCLDATSDSDSSDKNLIILFHGYGADAYDLQTLSEVIETPWPCDWIFPQGILEVPIGPGWTGRAWWNIDMEAFQAAAAKGETRNLANERPQGMDRARDLAFEMVEKLKVPWNKIILGGFSQGSMLATDLFLRAPEAPKGLIIYSGALVNQEEWKALAPKRAGSSFFMSHGNQDMVLAHRGAAQLETVLCQAGLKGKLMTFQGGHEIPMTAIQKTNEYLKVL